jgi:hypothetical protein
MQAMPRLPHLSASKLGQANSRPAHLLEDHALDRRSIDASQP